MDEQKESALPANTQASLAIDTREADQSCQKAAAPIGIEPRCHGKADSEAPSGLQLKIAIPYLAALLISFCFALKYVDTNLKVAMAWLIVGVVSSQVVVDLATFSSPKAKAHFSAIYRIIAGLVALGFAYFG